MSADGRILERFGSRVRELRKARGFSQETFAAKCDLDRSYISGIERGKRNVALCNIEAIARALGISISELTESCTATHEHKEVHDMASDVVKAIAASGLTIYDSLDDRSELYLDIRTLEGILNKTLTGLDLNYAIRTRSKVLKSSVCKALGYPVPSSFRRTRPRFLGQNFDTCVQKVNNLQIWNEDVSSSRRYVLVRVNDDQVVTRVKVVTGDVIAKLDKTGTLTTKYQVRSRDPITESCLVSKSDTRNVARALHGTLLPIQELYKNLQTIVGTTISNPGIDQERNRGAALHEAVCECLNKSWSDCGQFPDVPDQLLEIKLQTAPRSTLASSARTAHNELPVCPTSTTVTFAML